MEEELFRGLPAIDRIANGEQFLMMKAALPYLDFSMQQPLAVYIKFMELQNIFQFYQHPGDMSICSAAASRNSPMEMLQEISQYCNPAMREQFQQLLQIFQMLDLFSSMQAGASQEDLLGSFLSPEQQEMFRTYETMFRSE